MTAQVLFDNIGRKFTSLTCNYKPAHSVSGLHDKGTVENVTKIRTLLNGSVKLTKGGDIWTPGYCPAKGGPASFSSKEDGIKQVISVTWAD